MFKKSRPRLSLNNIGSVVFFCFLVLFGDNQRVAAQGRWIFSMPKASGRLPIIAGANPMLSLIAAGDLLMGGSASSTVRIRGFDFPFDGTRSLLQRSDVAMANLEAPFAEGGSPFDKKFTFRVPPSWAVGVANAGFDVLTLANNHILDYGHQGLFSTMAVLDSLDIAHCGAGRDRNEAEQGAIITKGDRTLGFLAYSLTYPEEFWATTTSPGTAYPHQHRLEERIRSMKSQVDFVVVSFHWGGELRKHPKAYQKQYAHQSIDWGADLVIGHHPHILQGLEIYKECLIAYSLGNYVFGSYSRNARDAALLKVWFDRQGSLLAEVIPISVDNHLVDFQPVPLKGVKHDDVIHELNTLSRNLNDGRNLIRDSGLILFE